VAPNVIDAFVNGGLINQSHQQADLTVAKYFTAIQAAVAQRSANAWFAAGHYQFQFNPGGLLRSDFVHFADRS
jgi:hypothetical protein